MIYVYKCTKCFKKHEVIKRVSEYKKDEHCPTCNSKSDMFYTPPNLTIDKTVPSFNPALGKVIKNKRELKYEIDKNDLVEVGNEKTQVIHKEMDKTKEHKKAVRWENALKEVRNDRQ